ncbi:MAG: tyrosine-type recombinase/integrase [Clostridia bacterium]|nr:tyrosine-type recombinase/integrase [Clostridia bacterium]
MAESANYHTQSDIKRLERLRVLEKDLPAVCTDFFRSIAQTTSTLTRLAYAYDFRLFFQYLTSENPIFGDVEPRMMTDKHLNAVQMRDIEGYQDYLTQYYVMDEETGEERVIQNHELGIMRKLSSLRSLFEYLFKNKHVDANIATLVSLPKLHDKPILRLEPDEMQRLLDTVMSGDGLTEKQQQYLKFTRPRDTAMLLLFLGTGIRVSECVGLNIEDLDFEVNAFLVTRKGGDQSILYFPQQVADALQEYLKVRETIETQPGHEDALFLSLQKRRITQRAVQNLVKKYALVAAPLKKRISPHKLRSTFGTNLYLETGDIYLVADVLGHSSVDVTRKHYAAMTDAHKREAARHVVLPETEPVSTLATMNQDNPSLSSTPSDSGIISEE